MALTPRQEFDLVGAVNPARHDLDGEFLTGFFEHAASADGEAAVAQDGLLQDHLVSLEEGRFLVG